MIKETCNILGRLLGPMYLQAPSNKGFLQISEGFWNIWNFLHCLGAIDGKHIDVQCPLNSGSLYFNYHKRYSVVLLAVCDHNYQFSLVDIGSMGKNSDGGIYANSDLNPEHGLLDIPEGRSRSSGSDIQVPYFFVGDEAFPIEKHMMRPYLGRHIGERKKWSIYSGSITANPDNITKYVLATVCLHNYVRSEEGDNIEFENCDTILENDENGVAYAVNIRDTLADYFTTSAGMVPYSMIM